MCSRARAQQLRLPQRILIDSVGGRGLPPPPPVAVAGPSASAGEKVKGPPNGRSATRRHVAVGARVGPRRPLSSLSPLAPPLPLPARKEYVCGARRGNRPRGACPALASGLPSLA